MLADGKISPEDVDLLYVTDDLDEATDVIVRRRQERVARKSQTAEDIPEPEKATPSSPRQHESREAG